MFGGPKPGRDPSDRPAGNDKSWKRKMGVELSGLENTRQWLLALAGAIAFVIVAMVIAWVAFG